MVELPPRSRKRLADEPLLPTRAPKNKKLESGDSQPIFYRFVGAPLAVLSTAVNWLRGSPKPVQQSPRMKAGRAPASPSKRKPPRRASLSREKDHSDDESDAPLTPTSITQAESKPVQRPRYRYTPEPEASTSKLVPHEVIDLVSDDEDTPAPRPTAKPALPTPLPTPPPSTQKTPGASKPGTTQQSGPTIRSLHEIHNEHTPEAKAKQKQSAANARAWTDINALAKPVDKPVATSSSQSSSARTASSSSLSKTSSAELTPESSVASLDPPKPIFKFGSSTPQPRASISDPKLHLDGTKLRATTHSLYARQQRRQASQPRSRKTVDQRRHIHESEYKAGLAGHRATLKANIDRVLYAKQKRAGSYSGSFEQFTDLTNYVVKARRAVHGQEEEDDEVVLDTYFKEWQERNKSINQKPLVKPWSPALDDLQQKLRIRDEQIEEATRPKYPDSLSPEETAQVYKFLRTPGVVSKCAREQVSASDLQRLGPAQWLNDEIINFYGAMLNERAEDPKAKVTRGQVLKAYYLSSFFWSKLEKDGYEKGRLAKWTKKIDIFSKDVVLIPINHRNTHWTAAAINFRQKRIESYDSLHMAGDQVCKLLRKYLEAEHQNKKKKPFDFTGWEDHVAKDNPQQENGFDCGVFTCQTLEALSRGEETLLFTQANMPYLRQKMIWEIGHAKLRDGF